MVSARRVTRPTPAAGSACWACASGSPCSADSSNSARPKAAAAGYASRHRSRRGSLLIEWGRGKPMSGGSGLGRGESGAISVLLVDDQRLMREGLRILLELQPDLNVVGEAGDGLEAEHLVEQLQPQIVLMDLRMP